MSNHRSRPTRMVLVVFAVSAMLGAGLSTACLLYTRRRGYPDRRRHRLERRGLRQRCRGTGPGASTRHRDTAHQMHRQSHRWERGPGER